MTLWHWDRLPDAGSAKTLLLAELASGGRATRAVAASALVHYPDRAGLSEEVRSIIDAGPPGSSVWAVWAYLGLVANPDAAATDLASSSLDIVRESIARLVLPTENGKLTTLAWSLIADPVRRVQLGVLKHFERADEQLLCARPMLEALRDGADPGFACDRCGTQNLPSAAGCKSCGVVTEIPSRLATVLLNKLDSLSAVRDAAPSAS